MSGLPLTVPPPRDDDHEDVAWALRAAAAQWKRDARKDAIQWVERAAESAEKVGDGARFTELSLLSAALERALNTNASTAIDYGPASIEIEEVEIDFDDDDDDEVAPDEVVLVDDDAEIVMLDEEEELIEEVEEVEEAEDVRSTARPGPLQTSRPPSPRSSSPPAPSWAAPVLETPTSRPPASSRPSSTPTSTPPGAEAGTAVQRSPSSRSPSSRSPSSRSPSSRLPSSRSSASRRPRSRPVTGSLPKDGPISRPLAAVKRDSEPAEPKAKGKREPRKRVTTTSRHLDLPPSMRPRPSGLDLAEEPDDLDGDEAGGYAFEEEGPTNAVGNEGVSNPPDPGEIDLRGSAEIRFEEQTAAEFIQGKHERQDDHDELERELGVNLSVRMEPTRPKPPSASPWEESSESQAPLRRPSPSSLPPGALPDDESPVPGRASVLPSRPPGVTDRVTSAREEPYEMAPSATAPIAAPFARPLAQDWGVSSHPPPPDLVMDERPSELPSVGPAREVDDSGPLSSAPDLDEFEDMFDKLSMPPTGPTSGSLSASPGTRSETPAPPDLNSPRATEPPLSSMEDVVVDGLDFLELVGFQDLPLDAARALARTAELRTLQKNREISGFGVSVVTSGSVALMPTIVDATCSILRKGDVLFTKGTLERMAAVRAVGLEDGTRVAVFSTAALEAATSSCPWVADDLREIADRYLTLAGGVLGALGTSLDDMFRFMVLEKCTVKSKPEGTLVATGGQPMDGMYILGAGSLEVLAGDGSVARQLAMGDFVFPETVLSASPASHTVRVGPGGALLLYANRMAAHELLATCPPLVETLAG